MLFQVQLMWGSSGIYSGRRLSKNKKLRAWRELEEIYIKWRNYQTAFIISVLGLISLPPHKYTSHSPSFKIALSAAQHPPPPPTPPPCVVNVTFEAVWHSLNGFVTTWIENVFVSFISMPLCMVTVAFISLAPVLFYCMCFVHCLKSNIHNWKKSKQREDCLVDEDSQCWGISGSVLPS